MFIKEPSTRESQTGKSLSLGTTVTTNHAQVYPWHSLVPFLTNPSSAPGQGAGGDSGGGGGGGGGNPPPTNGGGGDMSRNGGRNGGNGEGETEKDGGKGHEHSPGTAIIILIHCQQLHHSVCMYTRTFVKKN